MMVWRTPLKGFLIACLLAFWSACSSKEQELPALGADLSAISVSGLSSGGYMAGQFQVAHSGNVIGAGILAAGPYGCAQSVAASTIPYFPSALAYNLAQAENGCMADRLAAFSILDPVRLTELASQLASSGEIDPLSNLNHSKIYLYWGADDNIIAKPVVEAARNFYLAAGVPAKNVQFVTKDPGGHAFLTQEQGSACSSNAPPCIDNCHYDQAEAVLTQIYGKLTPKAAAAPQNFVTFSQRSYGSSDASLADEGVVYVPASCRTSSRCRIHIVFHGCEQSRAQVGDAVIRETGYADWAETNRIIVLFPQAASSSLNPQTCWDWWGYTGLNYLTKEGAQIKAVYAMASRLGQAPPQ